MREGRNDSVDAATIWQFAETSLTIPLEINDRLRDINGYFDYYGKVNRFLKILCD